MSPEAPDRSAKGAAETRDAKKTAATTDRGRTCGPKFKGHECVTNDDGSRQIIIWGSDPTPKYYEWNKRTNIITIPDKGSIDIATDPDIRKYSSINKVDPALVMAVIDHESNGRIGVLNGETGCIGLMQLYGNQAHQKAWNNYAQEVGLSTPIDPLDKEQNIAVGTRYISDLLKKTRKQYPGDEEMAVKAALGKYYGANNMKYAGSVYSKYQQYQKKR